MSDAKRDDDRAPEIQTPHVHYWETDEDGDYQNCRECGAERKVDW